ncbi:gamma-glutamyl-gamma-aminobutyrate hydrolase family protein [Desulfurivibrio dismutans]|uniref:gamma-glutamyl-gamma-aminobutyrate hydrolase family protein n=1 Tax=Desulfurivibrio dismutans TaxID=1398908 RepID=UPI0023DC7508|nr:gamma-glutamyl-gamma-aminobutyrate hydrolase family protein [Desulfurivibrio alkaliphilus]MDF1614548.1 gamma-glutamyl-gamma-aminobutyrate hydrolase family protein [Desulfurivibrio alkaliphilus]
MAGSEPSTTRTSPRPRPRPTVAVTGPDRGGWPAWFFTAWAVRRAGGRPFRVRPGKPHSGRPFDALIVGGGADVDPELYDRSEEGPEPQEIKAVEKRFRQRLIGYFFYPLLWILRLMFQSHGGTLDNDRDLLEKTLISRALTENKPILGICRGMQLLNVVRGGTLSRDLSGFHTETPKVRSLLPVKKVHLREDSQLAQIFAATTVQVNALHNQAVATLGHQLRVAGRESNKVIQAIEATDRWCIGVQWHPEYLPQKNVQQRLFQALIKATKNLAV